MVVGQESLDVLAGELGQAADLGVGSSQVLGEHDQVWWPALGASARAWAKAAKSPSPSWLNIRWSMLPGP